MTGALARDLLPIAAWGLAVAWCIRAFGAYRGMPRLPDLSTVRWNRSPVTMPGLTVVVPARNEANHLAATLASLAEQDYLWLQILAVNDRSTDATGAIADDYAARYPQRIRAIHIADLPEGWLGKTHAMQVAVEESDSAVLLFTDADVVFEPSILRRSLAFMEQTRAAHLVVAPTPVVESRGEGILLGFFQVLGLWVMRPWRVADPKARRDSIGVGAFNMVRRDALDAIGGLEPQRMAIIEDAVLGMRIKAAGYPQQFAVAPNKVCVHWAAGTLGIIRVMTKNLFSAVNFQPLLLLAVALGITLLFLAPLAGLFGLRTLAPSLLVLICIGVTYRSMRVMTSIDAWYGWFYPLGVAAFVWALVRSMLTAWMKGGVIWRGTHYKLRELREHNRLWQWQRTEGRVGVPAK